MIYTLHYTRSYCTWYKRLQHFISEVNGLSVVFKITFQTLDLSRFLLNYCCFNLSCLI